MHTVCGSATQVLTVSEPEKCEYVATMATPAECTESVLHKIREEMKLYTVVGKDVKDEL